MPWEGTIPIYINNYNRLTTTKNLAEYFDDIPKTKVVIIDNKSTYPPLLEWYKECPYELKKLNANKGHMAPWHICKVHNAAQHEKRWGSKFYVVTDSDLDFSRIPKDCIDLFIYASIANPGKVKIGPSLEINDLPPVSYRNTILGRQSDFWKSKIKWKSPPMTNDLRVGFYTAAIDTTFAIYRIGHANFSNIAPGSSLRSDRPYTARHVPWYLTKNNATEEDIYWAEQPKIAGNWSKYIKGNILSKK